MESAAPFRLDELGTLQFERLCVELLRLETGGADSRPWGLSLVLGDGVGVPGGERLEGPTLVLVVWLRHGSAAPSAQQRLRTVVEDAFDGRGDRPARSLLLLTNVAAARNAVPATVPAVVLGPEELWRLYASAPAVRFRVPSALGVADIAALVPDETARRSTTDIAAAVELARVFVPTRAYLETLAVLERHRFAVLTGPPEMGKTAIARMIGLAALTDGWEVHECIRPDELWSRFARDRRQVFVADDAFGSTEYRPEAAERWAVELDGSPACDGRPPPARVDVAAGTAEGRAAPHPSRARCRALPETGRGRRRHGAPRRRREGPRALPAREGRPALGARDRARADAGVAHRVASAFHAGADPPLRRGPVARARVGAIPHRRRRARRRGDPGADGGDDVLVPCARRRHRAVLLALLDAPPGPVSERELAVSLRRHSPAGLSQPAAEIVDRLADHFLRPTEPASVTWVHPSWRDLVIDELAADGSTRRTFLHACGSHGAALALSTAGGAGGDRALPLLRDDGDWDALGDRLAELAPALEPSEVTLLLAALTEARAGVTGAARSELDALATEFLSRLARAWSAAPGAVAVGLIAAWLTLASALPDQPQLPALATTWFELLPAGPVDLRSPTETGAFEDWTVLAELLMEHGRILLASFGFPEAQLPELLGYIASVESALRLPEDLETSDTVERTLRRIARIVPALAFQAVDAAEALRHRGDVRERVAAAGDVIELRPLSPELEHLLAQPLAVQYDESVVARVLRDL